MKKDNKITDVIFRKWPKSQGGDIIALFPGIPTDKYGFLCSSYQHIGQHGGADYQHVVSATRPATATEFYPLAEELTGLGYRLKVKVRRGKG
jgi:hypothetical protein